MMRTTLNFFTTLGNKKEQKAGDDMLFFVNERGVDSVDGFTNVGTEEESYFVRRRGSQIAIPRVSPAIDWEATYFLNCLCNRLEFILVSYYLFFRFLKKQQRQDLTLRQIVTSRSGTASIVESKQSRRIYASPHAVRMEVAGGKTEELTHSFPAISFQLHDHWGHTAIMQDRASTLGVELAVKGDHFLGQSVKCYVFRGALPYAKISDEYARVTASKWMWARDGEHIVTMRGPNGKGEAIMAVKKEKDPAIPTPTSTSAAVAYVKSWLPFGGGTGNSADSGPPPTFTCVVCSISLDWREIVRRITEATPPPNNNSK